jgi:hypothetical protein
MNTPATIEDLTAALREVTAERDEAISLLMPYALQFACINRPVVIDSNDRCNECNNCKSYEFVFPIIKWVKKGWRNPKVKGFENE